MHGIEIRLCLHPIGRDTIRHLTLFDAIRLVIRDPHLPVHLLIEHVDASFHETSRLSIAGLTPRHEEAHFTSQDARTA